MDMNPLVSIIIINLNGKKHLEKLLPSIFNSNYKNFELILIDNNSDDDSINFVEQNYSDINVIKLNKNHGFAEPNNIAAKIAKGKYLVFLNNDVIVTKNWLNPLITELEIDNSVHMAQSLILKNDDTVDSSGDFIDTNGRAFSKYDLPKEKRYILSCKGACMIIKKYVFLDLGGFDEMYFASFEDVELGWRAWLCGYKSILIPNSIVYHLGSQTIKKFPKEIAFHGVKNNLLLRFTHFDMFDAISSIIHILIFIIQEKLLGKKSSNINYIEFNIPDMSVLIKAVVWIVKHTPTIYHKRKICKQKQIITNKTLKQMGLITSS